MKKAITILNIGLLSLFVFASTVMADGTTTEETVCNTSQYGEKTCTTTTKKEVAVHEPIDTALGDHPAAIIAILAIGAGGLYFLSQKAYEL